MFGRAARKLPSVGPETRQDAPSGPESGVGGQRNQDATSPQRPTQAPLIRDIQLPESASRAETTPARSPGTAKMGNKPSKRCRFGADELRNPLIRM
jgi:hypothetical protein